MFAWWTLLLISLAQLLVVIPTGSGMTRPECLDLMSTSCPKICCGETDPGGCCWADASGEIITPGCVCYTTIPSKFYCTKATEGQCDGFQLNGIPWGCSDVIGLSTYYCNVGGQTFCTCAAPRA